MSSNKKPKPSLEPNLPNQKHISKNIKLINAWAKGDGNCLDLTEYLNINEWKEWHKRKNEKKVNIENLPYLSKSGET